MIKIIRHGTRQTKECERCGCLFSYDEVDTLIDSKLDSNTFEAHATRVIECPQCKEKIVLEATR